MKQFLIVDSDISGESIYTDDDFALNVLYYSELMYNEINIFTNSFNTK